jgi:hypothetical protein
MARTVIDEDDERDDASMEMELAEVAAREEAVKAMAPELATALRVAWRLIIGANIPFPDAETDIVEATMNKLIDAEGF